MHIRKNDIAFLLAAAILAIGAVAVGFMYQTPTAEGAVAVQGPQIKNASSTAYTVGTSASVRLLATSTGATGQRIGMLIQPINCAAGAQLFLNAEDGANAAVNSGITVTASSSLATGWYPSAIPTPGNSVQGITTVGTCTVLVTEFLTGN